jgi:hypothetical protein
MKRWWKVTFAVDGSSVWVKNETAEGAVVTAKLMAWAATNTWPAATAVAVGAEGMDAA